MLDDRDYMRSNPQPSRGPQSKWPVTYWLMGILVAAFFLQIVGAKFPIDDYFALSPEGLLHGFIWQLFTFQFLHAGIGHLLGNLVGLYLFGKIMEAQLGRTHFLKLYFLSGAFGGLLQCVLMWLWPQHFGRAGVVGASAGIFGLVAAFALMNPREKLYLGFLLPISAIYFLYGEIAYTLYSLVFAQDNIANGAHLGGILFAAAYLKWGLNFSQRLSELYPLPKMQRRESTAKIAPRPALFAKKKTIAADPGDVPTGEYISAQVDPILDKISAQGIQSLTDQERKILQAARSKMAKR